MVGTLAFFAVTAGLIWAVQILSAAPTQIELTWGNWIVGPYAPDEVAVAATCLLLIFLILWNFGIWALWQKPRAIIGNLRQRRHEEGFKALTRGMVALSTGDMKEASKQQIRAEARLPPNQALNKMLAAQIAEKNGDFAIAVNLFEEMTEIHEARLLGLQGLYNQARRDGDISRALALLDNANKTNPSTPWVLESLFRVQALAGHWIKARESLRQLERKKLVNSQQAKHWRAVVDIEASRECAAQNDEKRALLFGKEAYNAEPNFIPAVIQYAEMEIRFGRVGKAEKAISSAWHLSPHPNLLPVFEASIEVHRSEKQFAKFKALASTNIDHPESRIMLAREAVRFGHFEEARSHIRQLSESDTDARVCRLMADIELKADGNSAAASSWMAQASISAPDPAWVCRETGTVAINWSAISPAGAFDSLEWKRPNYIPSAQLPNAPDPSLLIGRA